VQTREWILTAAVIVVPLIIVVVVTLWSLDQVRYRPKKRRPARGVARETSGFAGQRAAQGEGGEDRDAARVSDEQGGNASGGASGDAMQRR
jgi:hypothetical protein